MLVKVLSILRLQARFLVSLWWMILIFSTIVPVAMADDLDGGFVWKIQKPNQPVSFLIGTVHVGKIGSTLPPRYQDALDQSKVLMVESKEEDFEGVDGAALTMSLQLLMQSNTALADELGVERLAKVNAMLRKNGSQLSLDPQVKLAPWTAFMLVATDYHQPGYGMTYGIDQLLIQSSKSEHKTIYSLETLEPMMAFQRIPKPVMLRALDAKIQFQQAEAVEALRSLTWYETGDSRRLALNSLSAAENLKYLPKQDHAFWRQWLFGDLLVQRNARWMPKIQRQINQQPTLIAVGAAHLFGGSGLIVLLREQGYTVTPVP